MNRSVPARPPAARLRRSAASIAAAAAAAADKVRLLAEATGFWGHAYQYRYGPDFCAAWKRFFRSYAGRQGRLAPTSRVNAARIGERIASA